MPIRRDQAHRAGLDDSRNRAPFRKIPGVLAGDRELRPGDHHRPAVPPRAMGGPHRRRPGSGIDGKSSRGSVWMRELNRSAVTCHGSRRRLPPRSGSRCPAARGRSRRASLAGRVTEPPLDDRCGGAPAAQSDLEVGRQQAHAAGVVRFEQDVPENRNGVLALDDPLAELKLVQQIALLDGQFHGDGDLDWRARIGWLKTMYSDLKDLLEYNRIEGLWKRGRAFQVQPDQ